MEVPIELTDVRISPIEHRAVSRVLINRLVFTRSRVIWIGVALLLVSFTAARELWEYFHNATDGTFPIWPLALLGGLLFFIVRFRTRLLNLMQQQFEKSPFAQQVSYIRADASGLRVENSLSSSSFEWAAFQRVMHINQWLLLFTSESAAFYLDTRRIVPPATTEDLLQLLRLNNIKIE